MINSKIFNKKEVDMANKINILNKGDVDMTSKINYIKKGTKYIIGATVLAMSLGSAAFGLNKENGYYLINDGKDLKEFAAIVNRGEVNAKGKLMEDLIELDKRDLWTPIKNFEGELISCNGGTIITGLMVDDKFNYIGLFGEIRKGGIVKDIMITDSCITGNNFVGGIAGANEGKIENCFIDDYVIIKGESYVGGNVGYNEGTIEYCENRGEVKGVCHVGGNVGCNYGKIENCENIGKIEGRFNVGGNLGCNDTGAIERCNNSGTVKGEKDVGGNVGYNYYDIIINERTLKNTGTVNGESAATAKKIGNR